MRGGQQPAKPDVARPLDGRVRSPGVKHGYNADRTSQNRTLETIVETTAITALAPNEVPRLSLKPKTYATKKPTKTAAADRPENRETPVPAVKLISVNVETARKNSDSPTALVASPKDALTPATALAASMTVAATRSTSALVARASFRGARMKRQTAASANRR